MANRIQLRRGTSTEWIQFNPVLAEAEFGVEIDTGRFKIGDGATPWQTLKYERPLESTDATPNTLILRDSNSSVKVKNITLSLGGKLFGTAVTADKFTTARLIGAASSSDLTGSASFDGSSNVDINFQLKTIFTGDTGLSYTKFNVDNKGRITSAQNPTTLSGYGIIDAQPLNGILTSVSGIGTGLGFLTKVETSTSNTSNTIVRSLEVSSGQLTLTNASGIAGNPIFGLANTTVTSGSYNTESLTSVAGSATVNTVKFTVDQFGRFTSATTIPIATASETQKGLASFNSEDFDVSTSGLVTIASQGVDNDQLQNPKIIIGTTDYVLGTTSTGFTTISDLTVDTDTLHVDKINHRLGIGTTAPGNFKVDISGTGRISGVLSSTQAGQRPIFSSFGVTSTSESGSAPFSVVSTRKVTNLNVDFLDDLTSLDFLRRTDDFNNANNEGNQYIATNFWIDATNVTVQDPIIDIGGGAKGVALTTNDNKDRGLTFQYYSSGSSRRAFIGWDNSSGGFALARDVTVTGEIVQGASTYAELNLGAATLRNGSLTIKTGGTNAGTLAASAEITTFTVEHGTGNTSISGTLGVTGNVNINTNKFNIVASSGNTSIAGTLIVTDNVTLNKNVTVVGSDTAATEFFKIQNGSAVDKFVVDSSSGNTSISGTLGVTGNVSVNTNKFNIIASSGNTSTAGTLGVTGATTLSSTLGVAGDVSVNTNKFNIVASSGNTSIAGTLGVTDATTLSSTLGVTGNTTLTGSLTSNGNVTLGDASTDTLTVNATSTFNAPVTLASSQNLTVGGNLTVTGDVTINGTTTTVNSTTITVDDKNIELGSIASPTDITADGGGITLKGLTDKTINWVNSTQAWTLSENLNLASGKEYRINGTAVIDSNRNILNIVNHTMSGNITVNTNKFTVNGSSGNTSIAGTLDVTSNVFINTDKFMVTAGSGNTSIAGTLSVTNLATFSSGVTIAGSTTAATEQFRITDGAATPSTKFLVDSSSGNTTIEGTLGVTGNVNINTNKFQIVASSGNTSILGTLSVTDNVTLNKNVTIVGSDTAATEFFKIQTGSAVDKFVVDSFSGNTTISGTLGVTGNSTLSGTLGVTAATTLSSTLVVTDNSTFNKNVTIVGSDSASAEFFKIQNGSAVDKFVVDSSSGNTTIAGTLGVTGNVNINTNKFNIVASSGNTSIAGTLGVTGDLAIATNKFNVAAATGNTSIAGTLGVTNLATFNNGVVVAGSSSSATEYFRVTDGTSTKFEIDSATGNTIISGTLGVTGATTLSSTLGVTSNFAVNTNKFTVNATTGDTLVAGTLGVTGVTTLSSTLGVTSNTSIGGTLSVTNLATFNNGVTIAGSTQSGAEFFRITDGASTPVTKFVVDSTTGNTLVAGTLGVTGATTLSSTLGVTGATTLTGLLNANGGIAVDTSAFTVAGDGTGNTAIAGTLAVTGNTTLTGDLAVNGADITTTATGTATLFNTNATTLNIGGVATTVSIGAPTGTTTINNANTTITGDLAVNGGDVTSSSTTFNLLNSTVTTLNIGGAAGTIVIGSGTSTATFNNNLTVSGNLTVNGTTTTINSTTLNVDDKNIELGAVTTPTDTTADGGGITLLGTTNKTFNWINATASWTSSENLELASGKVFRINGASVLSATTLGSGVTASSLTSVGTLTGLTVSGNTAINNITVASGTSTIATTSTNDLTLTPGGKTVTSKNFDVNATLTVVGQLNADNLRLDGNVLSSTNTNGNITLTPNGAGIVETLADVNFGSIGDLSTLTVIGQFNADNIRVDGNIISSTNANGNITLTPNGTGVVQTVNDVNFGTLGDQSTLTVIGQLNADNLRVDGNTISSTNTNGSITVTSNGTGTVVLGNVTGGTAITYDSTVAYNDAASPSNAPIIIHKDVAARGKFVIDGDVLVKGAFVQSGGGITDAGTTATVIEFNGGAAINGRETVVTSTGIGNSYNLDATRASEGGTYNPSFGVKYTVVAQRNSDNKRMMFEMMSYWDGTVEYYTSSGEIHSTMYALMDPYNLGYTFDTVWVNTGIYGMRATLRISNVPNGEVVTVRIAKLMLI